MSTSQVVTPPAEKSIAELMLEQQQASAPAVPTPVQSAPYLAAPQEALLVATKVEVASSPTPTQTQVAPNPPTSNQVELLKAHVTKLEAEKLLLENKVLEWQSEVLELKNQLLQAKNKEGSKAQWDYGTKETKQGTKVPWTPAKS